MKHYLSHILLALLLALLLLPGAAMAQGEHKNPSDDVAFAQRLGNQAPLDLSFVDEQGRAVKLGDYFGNRPVLLHLGYFECPMLCPLVRDGMVKALKDVSLNVGTDFQVLSVSVDPQETPMAAANAKAVAVSTYGRAGSADGWHFLTGTQDSISRLADAVGFKYFYDETIDQYAHAAGIVMLTPQGKLSRYFYGVEFNPSDLRLGLVESADRKIGSPVDQLLLLCYHFDPVSGKYTGLVMTMVRVVGVLTVIVLGAVIFLLTRGGSGRAGGPRGPVEAGVS